MLIMCLVAVTSLSDIIGDIVWYMIMIALIVSWLYKLKVANLNLAQYNYLN